MSVAAGRDEWRLDSASTTETRSPSKFSFSSSSSRRRSGSWSAREPALGGSELEGSLNSSESVVGALSLLFEIGMTVFEVFFTL